MNDLILETISYVATNRNYSIHNRIEVIYMLLQRVEQPNPLEGEER